MSRPATPVAERLAARVSIDPETGCHNWSGGNVRGYGLLRVGDKQRYTHRVAYELAHGPIPGGYQVDHLCRNPACINPEHLEAVTPAENTARSTNKGGVAIRTGKCFRGHGDWRLLADGRRYCGTCKQIMQRRRYERRRASR